MPDQPSDSFSSASRTVTPRYRTACFVLCAGAFAAAVSAASSNAAGLPCSDGETFVPKSVTLHAPVGAVYEPSETDFLTEIVTKAQESTASGQWARVVAKHREEIERGIAAPPGVDLPRSLGKTRRFTPIPSVLPEDHPLTDTLSRFRRVWVFLDGRDEAALRWAQEVPSDARIVLTGGNVWETTERLGRRVRFDTNGALVRRLGLTVQPSRVTLTKTGYLVETPDLRERYADLTAEGEEDRQDRVRPKRQADGRKSVEAEVLEDSGLPAGSSGSDRRAIGPKRSGAYWTERTASEDAKSGSVADRADGHDSASNRTMTVGTSATVNPTLP